MKKLFMLISLLGIVLVGCKKNDDPATSLTLLGESTWSVEYAGAEKTFEFETNESWNATVEGTATSWLVVTPSSGIKGKQSIKVEAKANNTTAARSGKITVQAKGKSVEIVVNQEALPADFDVTSAIEDNDFKTYCLNNFDTDGNGKISLAEAAKVEGIDVHGDYDSENDVVIGTIKSLKGIEFFTNLKQLKCYHNQLTSLDVAQNNLLEQLDCSYNKLTSLRLNDGKTLQLLNVGSNLLTSLDVSGFVVLEDLSIEKSPLMTTLSIKGCVALTEISVMQVAITSLDASGCVNLKRFSGNETKLVVLNMSDCTSLEDLTCLKSELTSVDISGCTALINLYVSDNKLTSINISNCTELDFLDVSNNQLNSIDVSTCPKLRDFRVTSNKITVLNIGNKTELTDLECADNQLSSLDLSNCPNLVDLRCNDNKLEKLELENCPDLEYLHCFNNQITSLDLHKNTKLHDVDLSPMNDASGKNVLAEVKVKKGQTMKGIYPDSERSTDYIPEGTTITAVE